jgi:hypothetical protein
MFHRGFRTTFFQNGSLSDRYRSNGYDGVSKCPRRRGGENTVEPNPFLVALQSENEALKAENERLRKPFTVEQHVDALIDWLTEAPSKLAVNLFNNLVDGSLF